MVTGRRAFDARTQASLVAAILEKQPPPVSTLQPLAPAILDRVVRTCLAKDPDERWQSAADLRRELSWIAEAGDATQKAPALRGPFRWAGLLVLVAWPAPPAAGSRRARPSPWSCARSSTSGRPKR